MSVRGAGVKAIAPRSGVGAKSLDAGEHTLTLAGPTMPAAGRRVKRNQPAGLAATIRSSS